MATAAVAGPRPATLATASLTAQSPGLGTKHFRPSAVLGDAEAYEEELRREQEAQAQHAPASDGLDGAGVPQDVLEAAQMAGHRGGDVLRAYWALSQDR